MKLEKNPERYALLDAEQLAYKLTGNSLYGQLGSGTFKIRLQALAASVTAYGRKQILFAKDAIEVFYGPGIHAHCAAKVVYGDTDSLFVEFNPRNPETGERLQGREARQATIDITDEAGHFITNVLAAPHDFEFDKAFDPMLIFSKKRYAGNMYENNADDYVHKYMGIALKRRDNAPIVKTIFGGAMRMLLDKRDVVGAFQFVKEKCLDLVDGKVNLGQLTVTKSLRANYANPDQIAHKVLADRITVRDPGNAPASGDRIGYVYIRPKAGQVAAALQGDRIETPSFIKENRLVPDYRHYIEHQLQNPISQAFALLLESIPGFHGGLLAGCPPVEQLDRYLGFREGKAAELLFTECLRRFDASSKRTAVASMFGGKCVTIAPHTPRVPQMNMASQAAAEIAPKGKSVQRKISGFLLDSHIVKTTQKQRAKEAKEAKETKD
jgi:DNA polymerase elongation subunit (family B)